MGIVGVLAACACNDAGLASEPTTLGERGEPPASRGEGDVPGLGFEPCEEAPDLECGTLRVPLDDEGSSGSLQLAVIRAAATGERIGSLFVNFGGPGGGDYDTLMFLADTSLAPLRERFDIVTFDPRGTGRSEPLVSCNFEAPPQPAVGDSAARAEYLDEHARRFAGACLTQTGPAVTRLGTNQVARDIDRLRAALGEETISFAGVSYGSELGAVYASLFPHRVRAMLLDGGVFDTYADYIVEAFIEQAAAAELTLARIDQLCRSDATCPLSETGLVSGVDTMFAALRQSPAVSADGSRRLDEAQAGQLVYIMLIGERSRWGRLPGLVAAALAGNYEPWFSLFPTFDPIELDPYLQAYAAILCNDLGGRRPASDFMPILEASEQLYPRVGKYVEFELLLRTCQAWPPADPPIVVDVANAVQAPILLVANEFDPATPMNWTRRLAHALGMDASLLRYQGGGHGAASIAGNGVPCIDAFANRYLFDLELPAAGSACPALPITFQPIP